LEEVPVPFTSLRWKTISVLAASPATQIALGLQQFFIDDLLDGLEHAEITKLASSAVNLQIRGWARQLLTRPHRTVARGKIDVNDTIKITGELRDLWNAHPAIRAHYPTFVAFLKGSGL
jgi:hypothetical protein